MESSSRLSLGRSKLSTSSRKASGAAKDTNGDKAVIRDEFGNNVTPQSLLPADNTAEGVGRFFSLAPVTHDAAVGDDASSFAGDISVGAASIRSGDLSDTESEAGFGSATPSGTGIALHETKADSDAAGVDASAPGSARPGTVGEKAKLTEEELNAMVTLVMEETDTFTDLFIPSQSLMMGTPAAAAAADRAARYAGYSGVIARGGDGYVSTAAQTLQGAAAQTTASKGVMAKPPATASAGSQATAWDIHDSIAALNAEEEEDLDEGLAGGTGDGPGGSAGAAVDPAAAVVAEQVAHVLTAGKAAPGFALDEEGAITIGPAGGAVASGAGAAATGGGGRRRRSVRDPASLGVTVADARAASRSAKGGKGGSAAADAEESKLGASDSLLSPSGGATPLKGALMRLDSSRAMSQSGQSVSDGAGGASEAGDSAADGGGEEGDGDAALLSREVAAVLSSGQLLKQLRTVEQAVQQNLYHHAHRLYRARAGPEALEGLLLSLGLTVAAEGMDDDDAGLMGVTAGGSSMEGGVGLGLEGGVYDTGMLEEGDEDEEEEDLDVEADDASAPAPEDGPDGEGGSQAGSGSGGADGEADEAAALVGMLGSELAVDGPAGVLRLFTYTCPALLGRNVTGMVWSTANEDLLAAAYGPSTYQADGVSSGSVALWSMSNPSYPQALAQLDVGITCLDFSTSHPNYLAAGCYDGRVCVFDVLRLLSGAASGPEVMSDALEAGSHTEAVWQAKWVPSEDGLTERLVTASTDGRVNEWSLKKGLHPKLLMRVRRQREDASAGGAGAVKKPSATANISGLSAAEAAAVYKGTQPEDPIAAAEEHKNKTERNKALRAIAAKTAPTATVDSDSVVSRSASALCIDFPVNDPTTYLVGTEDGRMHQCSVSYKDSPLDSHAAHSGPLNRLRISPYYPTAVLTASADWQVKLWDLRDGAEGEGDSGTVAPGGASSAGGEGSKTPAPSASAGGGGTMYSTALCRSAVTDVMWSPSVATRFASVDEGGYIRLWEVGHPGAPLMEHHATAPPLGQEDSAGFMAKLREKLGRSAAGGGAAGGDGDGGEDDHGLGLALGLADEEGEEGAGQGAETKQAQGEEEMLPQKLSCVLFAQSAPVLVTGDALGRIDVYRLMGKAAVGASAGLTSMEQTERLYFAMHPDEKDMAEM